ncbi:zinc transport system permease protein [Thermostichus sp. OS-CIW-31]|jgi:zinc/manganese transport system permease protein
MGLFATAVRSTILSATTVTEGKAMLEGWVRVVELLQLPFMQRAMLGGILTGMTGGLLGSFVILRQLSFFSDALGHSALLGIVLGVLLGLNPTVVLMVFGVGFALGVTFVLERTQLSADAVLNIIYSSSLALAVIALSLLPGYRGNLNQLLFGEILGISPAALWTSGILLLISSAYVGLTLPSQMLLTLDEPLARARGVQVGWQKLAFVVLLAVVVALAIRSVGVLLVSAFVVIPASTARLLGSRFTTYVLLAIGIGGLSAVLGMIASATFNLPSGPSIVATQLLFFLLAMALKGVSQLLQL